MTLKNKAFLFWIGAHVSAAGGLPEAVLRAAALGANAFGLFIKNQRRWKGSVLDQRTVEAFRDKCLSVHLSVDQILPHDSYLINLGHPEELGIKKSREALLDEVQRCERLGLTLLNIHPGSHLRKISEYACLDRIAQSINYVLAQSKTVTIVLENTAGQGSNVGYRLEHLSWIIGQIEDRHRIGVCLDTCHAFAAGYDLRTATACSEFFQAFDALIGWAYLKGMHLNGSKGALNSRLDRHASLDEGFLGRAIFEYIMTHDVFMHRPLILETPQASKWIEEIRWLRELV